MIQNALCVFTYEYGNSQGTGEQLWFPCSLEFNVVNYYVKEKVFKMHVIDLHGVTCIWGNENDMRKCQNCWGIDEQAILLWLFQSAFNNP